MGIEHAGYTITCDRCGFDKGLIYEADTQEEAFDSAIKEAKKSGWYFLKKGILVCPSCKLKNNKNRKTIDIMY